MKEGRKRITKNDVYILSWLALVVNNLESSERSASLEELSRSNQPFGMFVVELSWLLINVGEPRLLWAVPFSGQVVLDCIHILSMNLCESVTGIFHPAILPWLWSEFTMLCGLASSSALSSFLDFPQWSTITWNYKLNKPFPPLSCS